MRERLPVALLGGTGYVAGELLRLLAGHPRLRVAAVFTTSAAGTPPAALFPHLAGAHPELRLRPLAEVESFLEPPGPVALFGAGPHGESAATVARVLRAAAAAGTEVRLVDLSADFRFRDPEEYAAVYGRPHPAPELLPRFTCAVPEHHRREVPAPWVAHPGCFTTAVLLALVPLLALELVEPDVAVTAVTGSTGAGRTPRAATHHPERRSNLFAYNPLAHRHEPEMTALAAAAGVHPRLRFVPHAGPFARGIHVTLHATLRRRLTAAAAAAALARYYEEAPFVTVRPSPPRLTEVIGTNRCHLGVAVREDALVVFAVLDNLVKGAAGGGLQWLNRLCGWPETTGLDGPGWGWI